MARVLFLAFSGGGNLPPSLGIARELTARGHEVIFAGEPEMMPRMKSTPYRAIELTEAYAQLDLYPPHPAFGRWFCGLTSPAVEAQAREIVDRENPDVVLADFMFLAAQKLTFAQPSAALVHMPFFRVAEAFRGLTAMCSGIRQQSGFPALPAFDELMAARDRIIVTSLGDIDPAPAGSPLSAKVRHVGLVSETETHVRPLSLPWDEVGSIPVVLVSFSTDPLQADAGLLQKTLDAAGRLGAFVVATVGGSVDIASLSGPPNALIVASADHEQIMAKASLVITHGGHGTVMRALKHGVPTIVMPGIAPDQAINGAMVSELGAGRVIAQDASIDDIAALANEILAAPQTCRARAREVSRLFARVDGKVGAADQIEALRARRVRRAA